MSGLNKIRKYFEGRRIILPALLGVGVTFFFLSKDFDPGVYKDLNYNVASFFWLFAAIVVLGARFFFYMLRLKFLSEGTLSLKKGFQIVSLWEFASALSPGVVGGTAAAFLIIGQEHKMSTGKATAIVLATSYLDTLFYVSAVPIIFFFTGFYSLFPSTISWLGQSTMTTYFIIAYVIFFLWLLLLHIGFFINSERVARMLVSAVNRVKIFSRWESGINKWAQDLVTTSNHFRTRGKVFWLKSIGVTYAAWIARFLLVNLLVIAFGHSADMLAIFGKQLAMWSVLMVPATPGAIGLAEGLFSGFLGEYFINDQISNTVALVWRAITFYPILFLGVFVFPLWVRRIISEKRANRQY